MPLLLLLLFIGIPLMEIYILIQVGHSVGALSTIALCVLTAAIGAGLIRLQGLTTLMRARRTMDQGMAPAMEMLEGVALAIAGLMLLTPGFATDTLGFLLLIPPLRRLAIHRSLSRMNVHYGPAERPPGSSNPSSSGRSQGKIIDGDYERRD